MKNLPILLATVFGSLLIIVVIAVVFSKSSSSSSGEVLDQEKLVANAAHSIGPDDAPITIVEFSDLQCPACRSIQPIIDQVISQYPDKVRVVFRHFPLSQHIYARPSAQAAIAAQDSGQFWEYSQLLFDRQDKWSEISSLDTLKNTLIDYAVELGIDKDAFTAKMNDAETLAQIQSDVDLGREIGISATPTIFVNGVQMSAPQLLSAVQSLLAEQSEAK